MDVCVWVQECAYVKVVFVFAEREGEKERERGRGKEGFFFIVAGLY